MSDETHSKGLWCQLRRALLIALLAAGIGLLVNGRLLWRVLHGQSPTVATSTVDDSTEALLPLPVDLAEVRDQQGGITLLVDARSREAFVEGHLPGARSLPRGEFAAMLPSLQDEVPLATPLIVYCSGYDCSDSFVLAEQLIAAGYRQVRVFEGGLPEWRDAGLPVESLPLEGGQP